MKSLYINTGILAIFALALASCKPSIDSPAPSKGTADFSRYISIGNSLTSGFSDGGLYLEGQQNSFPGMIAEQMKAVGGGNFATPLFSTAHANGSGYLKLTGFSATGSPIIVKETSNLAIRGQVNTPGIGLVTLYDKYTGDINNYGIPGAKLVHATVEGYGAANGYYERLLTGDYGTNRTTYLDFVTAKPYTFFSMWLGNNDVLSYASNGAASDVLTPKSTFAAAYNVVINKLISAGAKGVVATVPDVLTIPYFRTVTLAALLAQIKIAAPSVTQLYIRTGAGVSRAATSNDLFTLPLSSDNVLGVNGYGLVSANPIESKYVIDPDEALVINDYVNDYNNTIRSVANAKGLAIMDAYSQFKEYGSGKQYNGITLSNAFISGNLFSLDGIHLTPVGYAVTANLFIDAINSKYGSTISHVDIRKYRGVKLP